jgi:hypothetical protein
MNSEERLSEIIRKIEDMVVTTGIDKGVVLLSNESPTHAEVISGKSIQVYDHENFSPLGDALIELYELASGGALRWYTWDKVSRDVWNGSLWWWDNGEQVCPVNIEWCPTSQQFFATLGQWGWTRAQMLEEMRGMWRPCIEPDTDKAYHESCR